MRANRQKAASSRYLIREGGANLPAVPEKPVVSNVPFVHLVSSNDIHFKLNAMLIFYFNVFFI